MHILAFFIIVISFILTEGFDIKLKYCRFRCSKSCEKPKDKSNPTGIAKPPSAYYWRDFYGVIPPDAYPLGPSSQFPQTYIGQVFDPENNGTFATTIFDGLDYVYTALNGSTTPITKHIQILCTNSPGDLEWLKLTLDNYKTFFGYQYVSAFYHVEFESSGSSTHSYKPHFIGITKRCHVTYAGNAYALTAPMEYALIDGSYAASNEYFWLMYKKKELVEDPATDGKSSESFFSHYSEYQIRPDSIIPKFYKQLTIGSCSITCTNENEDSNNKIKNDERLSSSMAYFWQPKAVFDAKEAPSVIKYGNRAYYIGQGFVAENYWDVGEADAKSFAVNMATYTVSTSRHYQVLNTNYPEKLQWVRATPETFNELDRNKLVPGGAVYNGTETFVCKYGSVGSYFLGSAREIPGGTYCYAQFGPDANYEVMTVQLS